MYTDELSELKKMILADEFIIDPIAAQKASPYTFLGAKTVLQKRMYYTTGYQLGRFIRLVELTHVAGPSTQPCLIEADRCLRAVQWKCDDGILEKARLALKTAAAS